jgi:hypothetical protein
LKASPAHLAHDFFNDLVGTVLLIRPPLNKHRCPHRLGSRCRFGHLSPPLSWQAVGIRLDVVLVEQRLAAEPPGLDELPHTAPADAVVDGARADSQDLGGFFDGVEQFFHFALPL